jgi:hypothetical protein
MGLKSAKKIDGFLCPVSGRKRKIAYDIDHLAPPSWHLSCDIPPKAKEWRLEESNQAFLIERMSHERDSSCGT